jgi:hypothetical protein
MTGNGRNPMPELTVMMAPLPRAIRCGMNASMRARGTIQRKNNV